MGNCAFGWTNYAKTGLLSASSEVVGLTASRVATDHGATSESWQTPVGTTSGWLQLDAGSAVAWGGASIHNTNLTPAATVRWRWASDLDALTGATDALPYDTDIDATLGANTTRIGTVTDPDSGSDAVEYDSISIGNSFVLATTSHPVIGGNPYRVSIHMRRTVVGGDLGGLLIRVQHPDGTISSLPAAGNVTTDWQQVSLDFTPATSGNISVWWFHGITNATGNIAIWSGQIEARPVYDSGVLSSQVVAGYRQAVHVLSAAITARYLRVDLADATNPENLLRIGQMFAGPLVRPLRNFGFGSTQGRAAVTPAPLTRGGQEFPELHHVRRAWSISMPVLHPDDVHLFVEEMQRASEAGGNVLFLPFPEGAAVAREAVFGRLLAPASVGWAGNTIRARTWSATISERL